MTAPATRPSISVVIPTREGWPAIRPCLDAFLADLAAVGGQLVVGDGSGQPAPDLDPRVDVVWFADRDASVFRLLASGLDRAEGEIVALTEDHAVPGPGWIHGILRAHAAWPDAAAVGGAIENGSTDTLLDWGSYFMTQGPFRAPLPRGRAERVSTEANLSFKRRALEGRTDGEHGYMAFLHLLDLRRRGESLVTDDRLVVDHFQAMSAVPTLTIHFHNGRTIGGFRRGRIERRDVARLGLFWAMPILRALRTLRTGWAKGRDRGLVVASMGWVLACEYAHGAGEIVGYALGVGSSPKGLR